MWCALDGHLAEGVPALSNTGPSARKPLNFQDFPRREAPVRAHRQDTRKARMIGRPQQITQVCMAPYNTPY
jgi:hypothetical protein